MKRYWSADMWEKKWVLQLDCSTDLLQHWSAADCIAAAAAAAAALLLFTASSGRSTCWLALPFLSVCPQLTTGWLSMTASSPAHQAPPLLHCVVWTNQRAALTEAGGAEAERWWDGDSWILMRLKRPQGNGGLMSHEAMTTHCRL